MVHDVPGRAVVREGLDRRRFAGAIDRRQLDPVRAVQRGRPALGQVAGDRAQDQRVDGGDRLSGAVGDGQRHRVRRVRPQPHAQRVRASGVQGDSVEGERHPVMVFLVGGLRA